MLPIPTKMTAKWRLQHLDPDGVYLNFNYTPTLTCLYEIPEDKILHIHGEATKKECKLILGHAWAPEQQPQLHSQEDEEEMDTRMLEAHQILKKYFSSTFKPSELIIKENNKFFESLSNIQEVHVLGHSLSDVDWPYLQALMKAPSVAAAKWYTTYYPESDRAAKLQRLLNLGVSRERAFTAPLDSY